jgi:predicted transcriptional regulator of viral defense system
MAARGQLRRIGRGLYTLPNHEWSESHSLAEVAKAVPSGVVCLLSALRFHDIGTQSPFEVWVAIPRDKAGVPRAKSVQVRVLKFSNGSYTDGIELYRIENTEVRVYGIAKTVADCWRFRNKIGVDVALEALRDVITNRRASLDDLRRFGQAGRVWNVMRPYVEAIV